MVNDYVPRPVAQFHTWQNNFVTYVNGYLADLGLAAGNVVDLNNSAATWTTDHDIPAVQELLGHNDVRTTMIYTHVLNRGGKGVKSPVDSLGRRKRCVLCGNHIRHRLSATLMLNR